MTSRARGLSEVGRLHLAMRAVRLPMLRRLSFGRSLLARLIALSVLWTAALLIAGGVGITSYYADNRFRVIDEQLEGVVTSLLENVVADEGGVLSVVAPQLDPRFQQTYSGRYWEVFYIDQGDGRTVSIEGSRSLFGRSIEIDPALFTEARSQTGARVIGKGQGPESQPLRVMAQAVLVGPYDDLVVIAAARERASVDRRVRTFAMTVSGWLAAFAVGLLAAVFLLVRWGLAPVFKMHDAVIAVREGERERLDEDAPSELVPLAHELNALIDHNRDLVERARAHVGNLAHALKTPISVLLNESRSPSGDFAETVRKQTEKMQVQVEHHIRRAQAAARAQAHGSRADVRAVVDDLARTLPRMYPQRKVALEVTAADDLHFRGERQDLEEMIGNLLDNAFKWTRSRVRVSTAPADAQGQLVVQVDDDGSGLAPEQRTEVIARGARLDEAAPGFGLGLAIVHDLARVYGGRLELGESPWGGLRATITLPSVPPPRRAAGR